MTPNCSGHPWPHALIIALAISLSPLAVRAQTVKSAATLTATPTGKSRTAPKGKTSRASKKTPAAPVPVPEFAPAEPASAEQLDAAERVYYGIYDCEFKQTIDILRNPKFPGFVDVRHAKAVYVMKPVLSSTGAIRLEDVRAETLMVQISSKSMLLNVQTGHRIVDDCVSPRQRELIEAARLAKAAAAASAAASGEAPRETGGSALLMAPPPRAAASSPAR